MSDQYIMECLQARLQEFAINRGLNAAFEGNSFTPDAKKTYLADFLLPAETGNPSIGRHHARYQGVYQIDVDAPSGKTGALRTLSNDVAAHFPRGLSLTHSSGLVVTITRTPSISRLMPDGGRMKRSVSVRYSCDAISN